MSNVILAPDGMSARQIVKQYDPKLCAALAVLDHYMNEQGLGLHCMRCHALGMNDGVRGQSTPEEFVLECGCTRRTLSRHGQGVIH